MVKQKKDQKPAYEGRKRGRKPHGGYYGTVSIRVPDEAAFNQIADLYPAERGAALLAGLGAAARQAAKKQVAVQAAPAAAA